MTKQGHQYKRRRKTPIVPLSPTPIFILRALEHAERTNDGSLRMAGEAVSGRAVAVERSHDDRGLGDDDVGHRDWVGAELLLRHGNSSAQDRKNSDDRFHLFTQNDWVHFSARYVPIKCNPWLASICLYYDLVSVVEPLAIGVDHASAVLDEVPQKRAVGIETIIFKIAEQLRGDDKLGVVEMLDDATFGSGESGGANGFDIFLGFCFGEAVIRTVITIALDNQGTLVRIVRHLNVSPIRRVNVGWTVSLICRQSDAVSFPVLKHLR